MTTLFKHWKTTVAGLLIGVFTVMLYNQQITVEQWAEGLGALAMVIGLLAKDWDKTNE